MSKTYSKKEGQTLFRVYVYDNRSRYIPHNCAFLCGKMGQGGSGVKIILVSFCFG